MEKAKNSTPRSAATPIVRVLMTRFVRALTLNGSSGFIDRLCLAIAETRVLAIEVGTRPCAPPRPQILAGARLQPPYRDQRATRWLQLAALARTKNR